MKCVTLQTGTQAGTLPGQEASRVNLDLEGLEPVLYHLNTPTKGGLNRVVGLCVGVLALGASTQGEGACLDRAMIQISPCCTWLTSVNYLLTNAGPAIE